jgi:hypothetical protein
MIASIFIIAISVVLFAYWLRYSCVLLLRSAQERVSQSALVDDRFSVSSVLERLKSECELDPLERALERDYRVLSYLINHAADLELMSVENRLLILNYRVMRIWSRMTRSLAPDQSRRALGEMASVLSVLVTQMAEHSSLQIEA